MRSGADEDSEAVLLDVASASVEGGDALPVPPGVEASRTTRSALLARHEVADEVLVHVVLRCVSSACSGFS